MEVSGQLHAPAALLQKKSPWYPLERRLGEPQNRSARLGEDKNLALIGIRYTDCLIPAHQRKLWAYFIRIMLATIQIRNFL
jgi:hypothetical protein